MTRSHLCEINNVGKNRNGSVRYWCIEHYAPAYGDDGNAPILCTNSEKKNENDRRVLELNPTEYPGGVAVWGALPPAYSNFQEDIIPALHVHARKLVGADLKEIDNNFDAVKLYSGKDLFGDQWIYIDHDCAISYFISKSLELDIKYVRCNKCQFEHVDTGYYATFYHTKHLCQRCGNYFYTEGPCIGNPIIEAQRVTNDQGSAREIEKSKIMFNYNQSQFAGGVSVWASNRALIWTASRPEQEGVHIHGYDQFMARCQDETFGPAILNNIELDNDMIRIYMAQMQIEEIAHCVMTLKCPQCSSPHFDRGELAIRPHENHECEECGTKYKTFDHRSVISNPFHDIKNKLISDQLK